jgi:predicted nucleic acid-binding protein
LAITNLNNLNQQGVDLWISRQILREYLAAMSRLNTLTIALPLPSLANDVKDFTAQFEIAEDNQQVTEELLKLFSAIAMGGKQVHDANIVATMLVYGIERLLTHNVADFVRFSHLITIIPLVTPNAATTT